MNSIARMKAAIHFENPDRAPVINLMLPWGIFKGDIAPYPLVPGKNWNPGWAEDEIGLFPYMGSSKKWNKPDWAKKPEYNNWKDIPHEEIDEWGCIWVQDGKHRSLGHPGRATLTDLDKIEDFATRYFPDPNDESRFRLAKISRLILGRSKYHLAILGFGPITVAMDMLGLSRFLVEHRKNPDKISHILELITENFVGTMKSFKRLGYDPHGFMLYDDLGHQTREFMSPKLFQKMYEPVYRTLYEQAHELGADFIQHSCGKIDRYISILKEWGLDALELDSPRMTGYPDLRPFRGKMAFFGCVNIQSIYVNGSPEEVKREVWHMMRNLGTKEGGFGAYYYPQDYHILAPKENVKAFRDGLKQFGKYKNIPKEWWETPFIDEWDDNVVPALPYK